MLENNKRVSLSGNIFTSGEGEVGPLFFKCISALYILINCASALPPRGICIIHKCHGAQ